MPRDRLLTALKYYSPTGRRNKWRHLKRLLDMWDPNGSTGSITVCWLDDDDDDDDDDDVNDDDDDDEYC